MLVGIIKNKDNSFEYLDMFNNKLYCTHLDSKGFTKSDMNYVKNIFKKLFFNSNCIYISKYKDYDIYYDRETTFKHFVKEGKEDYNLFYHLNGIDALLYDDNEQNTNKSINTILKRFIIGEFQIILSFNIVLLLLSQTKTTTNYDIDKDIDFIYNNEEISQMYDYGTIDYNDAIDLINKSNIENDMKDYLINKELLQDVFKYYNGSTLQYSANLKFENFQLSYFDVEEYNKNNENKYNTVGYYCINNPNILFVSDDYENEDIKSNKEYRRIVAHEYIHLLQSEGSPYKYLIEASAELLSKEYFNNQVKSYKPAVKNLMLLTDIIGPEPIMELSFSGTDENFNDILKNNLNEEEYSGLIKYFQDSTFASDHLEENNEIQSLLCTLYKNMYDKDITEDNDILYDLIYNNDNYDCTNTNKYYLNVREMENTVNLSLDKENNIDYLYELGLANDVWLNTFEKTLTLEEYNKLKNSNIASEIKIKVKDKGNIQYIKNGERIEPIFVYNKEETTENGYIVEDNDNKKMSIEDAYELGYITFIREKETSERNMSDDWNIISSRKCTIFNNGIYSFPIEDNIMIPTKSLKIRFKEQYNKMIKGVDIITFTQKLFKKMDK